MNRVAAAYQPIDPDHLFATAANVHMLDHPRSVIEDVRPVAPAAPAPKHVFSLSIFHSS